jgi:hypothetical protein
MTFLQFCQAQGILIDATPPMGVWKRYKTLDKPKEAERRKEAVPA